MKKIQRDLKKLFAYKQMVTALQHCNGNKDYEDAVRKHFSRQGGYNITTREWCYAMLRGSARNLLNALPDEGYSMGSIVKIKIAGQTFVQDRRVGYAKSCRYTPTWGAVTLCLSLKEWRYASNIGGLLTVIYPQKSKVKKCYWFEGKGKKQNFELIKVAGYIFEGYHAGTKAEALEGGNKKLEAIKQAEKSVKAFAKACRRQYSYSDSLAAGNCEAGTRVFIMRLGLDANNKYRGTYLIKQATKKSANSLYYVKNMINYFAK